MRESLAGVDWLHDPKTRSVMSALNSMQDDCARFVGGCVRNALIDEPVSDIDIATQLKPDGTLAALDRAGIRAVPTGIEHGTITAVVDGTPFEITSLRRDVETDGRRAVVAFTTSWDEDAQRRDFNMNALYADADGVLFDPTGQGLSDLAERRVAFIGDAEQRLREDHLRNLRFFRFSAWYGSGLDPVGLAACRAQREGLGQIAAERIWTEIHKLLSATSPWATVKSMFEAGVMEVVMPHAAWTERAEGSVHLEMRRDVKIDAMQRLMALLEQAPDTAATVAERLRLSGKERSRLVDWAKSPWFAPEEFDELSLCKSLYTVAQETGVDCVLSDWSRNVHDGRDHDWQRALELARIWTRPTFPLTGKDLVKAGFKPGPELGELLSSLEARWVESGFTHVELPFNTAVSQTGSG